MRLVGIALGLVGLMAVACNGTSEEDTGSGAAAATAISPSAVGGYYTSTPTVGGSLKIYSVSPFRFEYIVMSKTVPMSSDKKWGGIYDALGNVGADGRITYAPADDCSLTFRVRNDGVEVRQVGTCASESFPAGLDGTGVYNTQPKQVGDCQLTTITDINARLDGDTTFESGTSINYENMLYGVSYDKEAAVIRSRKGDQVRVCLESIPTDCPPGDDRGRFYKATNLRTNESWSLPDSQHMCGGA